MAGNGGFTPIYNPLQGTQWYNMQTGQQGTKTGFAPTPASPSGTAGAGATTPATQSTAFGTYQGSNPNGSNFTLQPQSSGNNVYQGAYDLGPSGTGQQNQALINAWMANPYQSPDVAASAPGYNTFNGTSSNTPMSPYGAGNNVPFPSGYSATYNAGPMTPQTSATQYQPAQVPYAGTPTNIPSGTQGQVNNPAFNTIPQAQQQTQALSPYALFGGFNSWGNPQQGNPYAYMTNIPNNGLGGQTMNMSQLLSMLAPQLMGGGGLQNNQPLSYGYGNLNPLLQNNGSLQNLIALFNAMQGINTPSSSTASVG